MARIVYFSFPAYGHIYPTLPVMRELAGRGERIFYYGTERFKPLIRQAGALFCPYTSRLSMPEHGPGPYAQVSTTIETLIESSGAVLDSHLAEVRSLRPTHIMFDSFAPWGRLVAQLLGLPAIASVPSILIDGEIAARYGAGAERQPEDPRLTPQWYAAFRRRCHARLLAYRSSSTWCPGRATTGSSIPTHWCTASGWPPTAATGLACGWTAGRWS